MLDSHIYTRQVGRWSSYTKFSTSSNIHPVLRNNGFHLSCTHGTHFKGLSLCRRASFHCEEQRLLFTGMGIWLQAQQETEACYGRTPKILYPFLYFDVLNYSSTCHGCYLMCNLLWWPWPLGVVPAYQVCIHLCCHLYGSFSKDAYGAKRKATEIHKLD